MDLMHTTDDNVLALRKANPYATRPAKSRMPSNAELLRKGLARQLEREPHAMGKADAGRRIDLGEVKTTRHGVVTVAHDVDQGALVVHGIAIALDEIDPDLRSLFISSSATLNSVQDSALQEPARTAIALMVNEALRRDKGLAAAVQGRRNT